ncbi:M-phase inducer phosphatase 3 [Nematocida minor]|uniref:M-phase inducer phosphatase 3 n=1 Tax=Nematocida minor TaxID=1912983 RepID=UPI00221F2C38|nr:M-phase inducer phosphatase 3 [Nematocida minor]KAI5192153.1 M-phase inducer phosphatase 3 [Nematocida minor]
MPSMSNLESELDIIILDEREMEEIGKTLVQGISTAPKRAKAGMGYEEILKSEMQINSVTFSYTFEEIFNKELRWRKAAEELPRKRKAESPDENLINAISYQKKDLDGSSVFQEKQSNSILTKKLGHLKRRRSNSTQPAHHWSRASTISKSETDMVCTSHKEEQVSSCVPNALPSIGTGPSDSIFRVSIGTVASLLGKPGFVLIDCRFEYEYTGGHIQSAINITTQKEIKKLFNDLLDEGKDSSLIIIFYCEYSSVRAPRLAISLRNEDRLKSAYPYLKFPNVYVMEGGYRDFYKSYSKSCVPCSYIPM